ncbi:MAG: restriction endonuclease subunit S [Rubrobacter sp.]|nr:restriction endonuclease subunit S [Rubrobacter sp.]
MSDGATTIHAPESERVPPGYKRIEVGVIAEEWEVANLASLGDGSDPPIKAGPFGSALTKATYVPVGYKVYGQEQVIRGDYQYGDYFVSHAKFKELESCSVKSGDILLSLVGTAGKLLVIPRNAPKGIINPRLIRFSFDKERVDSEFFKELFEAGQIQSYLERYAQGGTMGVLNASILRAVNIPLPPLPEQRAIAAALSDVDDSISALDALIAKKRAVKTAAMQRLLTGKHRLPGFDGEWETRRLGDIFALLSTASNARSDLMEDGDIGYIHYGDIHGTDSSFLDCDAEETPHIASHLVKNIPLLEEGDLVMADASEDYDGIGKSIEVKNVRGRKLVAGLHTLLLRGNKAVAADGFKGYLQYIPALRSALIRLSTGISVYGISKNNVRSIEISLPSIEEQTAIAAVLSDMDAKIESLEARREKTRKVKRGMMGELLTGRTRLV